jgi:membrane-associated phospholipid phosphatase
VFPRSRAQTGGAFALAIAAAYAALAVLVAAGSLSRVDQWSVDHVMPGLSGGNRKPSLVAAVVPLLHSSWARAIDVVANVVALPAQAVIASILAGWCCLTLWRRGDRQRALAWGFAWVGGNTVEALCKSILSRPLLHAHGDLLVAFQSSFPSGHTLRSVLLAAAVAEVWPAARTWVAAWAAATLVLLELGGFHVPSDIAGGLLLALLLVCGLAMAARRPGSAA